MDMKHALIVKLKRQTLVLPHCITLKLLTLIVAANVEAFSLEYPLVVVVLAEDVVEN